MKTNDFKGIRVVDVKTGMDAECVTCRTRMDNFRGAMKNLWRKLEASGITPGPTRSVRLESAAEPRQATTP